MVPDVLFAPRVTAYVMIGLSAVVVVLAVVNIIWWQNWRNAEAERKAGQEVGCQLLAAINDVAVEIPLANIGDLLAGSTLSPQERTDRLEAQARYLKARATFAPQLERCVR